MSDKKEHIEQAELFKNMLLRKFSTKDVVEALGYLRDFRNELLEVLEWLKRNLFYDNQDVDNERIEREGLMIQLEEVRKQRDEMASQLMTVRLEHDRTNPNEPEPQGYKEFNDFLKEENQILKDAFVEVNREYSQSQRELNELKGMSSEFIGNFESIEEGKDVTGILTAHYNNLKSILK